MERKWALAVNGSEPKGQLEPLQALGTWARLVTSLSLFRLLSKKNRNLHFQGYCDNSTHTAYRAVATQHGSLPLPSFPHLNPMSPTHRGQEGMPTICPPRNSLPQPPSMLSLPQTCGYSHHGHAAAINDHSPQPVVPRFPRQVQLKGCIEGLVVPLEAGHCIVRLWLSRGLPRGPLPSPQESTHLRLVLTTGSQGTAGLGTLPPGLSLALQGGIAP